MNMVAHKFASSLNRRWHRIVVILVYTMLEWFLIIFLLFNALFSYLITKFAFFFGLPIPCLWCSRLDHLFEPRTSADYYRSLLCDAHASEISALVFCSKHRRLVEACEMCGNCSSSMRSQSNMDGGIALLSLIPGEAVVKLEAREKDPNCSCCGAPVYDRLCSPCLLVTNTLGVLKTSSFGNLVKCKDVEQYDCTYYDDTEHPAAMICLCDLQDAQIEDNTKLPKGDMLPNVSVDKIVDGGPNADGEDVNATFAVSESNSLEHLYCLQFDDTCAKHKLVTQVCCPEDPSVESLSHRFEQPLPDERLLPIELIDCLIAQNYAHPSKKEQKGCVNDSGSVKNSETNIKRQNSPASLVTIHDGRHDMRFDLTDSLIAENYNHTVTREEKKQVIHSEKMVIEGIDDVPPIELESKVERDSLMHPSENRSGDGVAKRGNGYILNHAIQNLPVGPHRSEAELRGLDEQLDSHTNGINFVCHEEHVDLSHVHGQQLPNKKLSWHGLVPDDHKVVAHDNELVDGDDCSPEHGIELDDQDLPEDVKLPEMRFSPGNIETLHTRLLAEKKESGAESLDGSIISDTESGELTVERLKSALQAERKALTSLYAELDEERNAAAVAASQTMAMITRLQEEKAAMWMEASHYQRMMEEQSEYDQEALQLLSELMVQKDKEKQELEKELELCHRKIFHYEAKEKRMMTMVKAQGSNQASVFFYCSEYGEAQSPLLNDGIENSYFQGTVQDIFCPNVHVNSKLSAFDKAFTEFEQEKFYIMEHLKELEKKLYNLDDNDDHFEDMKLVEQAGKNGGLNGQPHGFYSTQEDGSKHDLLDEMSSLGRHHHEAANLVPKTNKNFPLSSEIDIEFEEDTHENQNAGVTSGASISGLDKREPSIMIVFHHVFDRLHALEVDTEFLKHCASSLKKGDRGVNVLQEILQHLRDLKAVEFRAKNTRDSFF